MAGAVVFLEVVDFFTVDAFLVLAVVVVSMTVLFFMAISCSMVASMRARLAFSWTRYQSLAPVCSCLVPVTWPRLIAGPFGVGLFSGRNVLLENSVPTPSNAGLLRHEAVPATPTGDRCRVWWNVQGKGTRKKFGWQWHV